MPARPAARFRLVTAAPVEVLALSAGLAQAAALAPAELLSWELAAGLAALACPEAAAVVLAEAAAPRAGAASGGPRALAP
jgi:hypothetical protein